AGPGRQCPPGRVVAAHALTPYRPPPPASPAEPAPRAPRGNQQATRGRQTGMGCEQVREALSARLDGEETGMAAARLEAHLAGCAGCAAWLAQAERLDRMVAHAQPVPPDLTAGILAAVAADPRTRSRQAAEAVRRTRRMILRVALAVAAAVQVVAVLPVLAGADLHLSREIASFELAMAVGFWLAAWRPERARGFVPVAVVLAAALALTSVVDVLSARTAPAYEAGHLVAVVQAGLLWALARYERRGPRIAGPAAGTAGAHPRGQADAGPAPGRVGRRSLAAWSGCCWGSRPRRSPPPPTPTWSTATPRPRRSCRLHPSGSCSRSPSRCGWYPTASGCSARTASGWTATHRWCAARSSPCPCPATSRRARTWSATGSSRRTATPSPVRSPARSGRRRRCRRLPPPPPPTAPRCAARSAPSGTSGTPAWCSWSGRRWRWPGCGRGGCPGPAPPACCGPGSG